MTFAINDHRIRLFAHPIQCVFDLEENKVCELIGRYRYIIFLDVIQHIKPDTNAYTNVHCAKECISVSSLRR